MFFGKCEGWYWWVLIYHLHYASLVDNLVQLRFKNAWCVASGASDSDISIYLFQNFELVLWFLHSRRRPHKTSKWLHSLFCQVLLSLCIENIFWHFWFLVHSISKLIVLLHFDCSFYYLAVTCCLTRCLDVSFVHELMSFIFRVESCTAGVNHE